MAEWACLRRTPRQNAVVDGSDLNSADIQWTKEVHEGASTPIVVWEDTLYFGTSPVENRLVAMDITSGSVRWSREYDEWVMSLTTDGQTLYVGSHSGVEALDPATRTVNWSTTDSHADGGEVLATDDRLFSGGEYGKLLALDPDDGSELWSQWHNNLATMIPTFDEDRIYVPVSGSNTSAGGTVHAYTHEGDPEWTFDVEANIEDSYFSGGVSPVVVDDVVVTSSGPTIFALDVATGDLRWAHVVAPDDNIEEVCSDGNRIFGGTQGGTVVALNPATGTEHWRAPYSTSVVAIPHLTLAEDRLYVTRFNGSLTVYEATTGKELFSDEGLDKHVKPATVHDDVVFLGMQPGLQPDSSGSGTIQARSLPLT